MAAPERIAALRYAVRPTVVGKYLGQLAWVIAGLQLVPAITGLAYGEYPLALIYLGIAVALATVAWPLSRLAAPGHLQANEALAITALAYLLAVAATLYPALFSGLSAADAVFEMVSGVTTTGLTTLASPESLPATFVFARAWSQWYGGLGIAVLAVAMLSSYDLAARRLAEPASGEPLVTTTLTHARRVSVIYLLLTLLGIVGLLFAGLPLGQSLDYTLAAVSTGGFSPNDGNLGGVGLRSAHLLVTGLALLGAISLPLYYLLARGQWRRSLGDVELKGLAATVILVCGLLLAFSWVGGDGGFRHSSLDLVLLGLSAQTTSGFSTLSVADLDAASKWTLIMAMAVGGSVGSTAGGIKLLRLLLVLRLLQLLLRRMAMPSHAVSELSLGGRKVEDEQALRALVIVLLFLGAAFLSWLPFLAAGYPPLDALFEVVSALGTVGLSTGITAAELAPGLKVVLCLDMLLGRLEFIAVIILFLPSTWMGRHNKEG